MAWVKIEVCDICRNTAKTKSARPIGWSAYGTRVCPTCARTASIKAVDNDTSWLVYLCDSEGVASAQVGTLLKRAGSSPTINDYVADLRAQLATIAARTR
jgi:hypothetical protein